MRIQFSLLAVVVALLVPVGAASADAASYKKCGEVNARNGGKARSIVATGRTTCRTARRVARRAKGRRFTTLGYKCFPQRVPGEFNKLYGCAHLGGTRRGVGFFYKGPRR